MGKAFLLKSGGGGGGLNFRVLSGTSAPASPKTNDIWVNTSVEIPEWAFTASDPYTVDIYKTGTVVQGLYIKLDTGEEYTHELYSTLTVNLPDGTYSITVPADNASTTTVAHAFYDANGALISTVQRLPNTVTYDVPSGAVMARVSYYQTDTKSVTANINTPEGAVWIFTGTASTVEFNALKKNSIQVYPISAKQYISGAWVTVTAKSYQGGEWVDWLLYLYDSGDQCKVITGGWQRNASYYSQSSGDTKFSNSGTVAFNDDSITVNSVTGNSAIVSTINLIDVTEYNKLKITTSIGSYYSYYFALMPSGYYNCMTQYTAQQAYSSSGTVTMDISDVSGSYYICIVSHNGRTQTVTKVWMEK